MTDKALEELQEVTPAEAEIEEEDNNDYAPALIEKVLKNPELLPREIREDFESVFEGFEYCRHRRCTKPSGGWELSSGTPPATFRESRRGRNLNKIGR